MMTGALLYRTLETMVRESKETKVPEPEFKPFRFPDKEAVATPIRTYRSRQRDPRAEAARGTGCAADPRARPGGHAS